MDKSIVVFAATLFLGSCTQLQSGLDAARGGIGAIKQVRYEAAMLNENVRCQRSLRLVLKMADARGDDWFDAYVASCPDIQAVIKRIAGAAALSQGFKLVPSE